MKLPARRLPSPGITLIEIITAAAILGLMVGLGSPYLFGHREKARLEGERDKITSQLKIAQQKAIGAYKGEDQTVEINLSGIIKDSDGQTYTISDPVEITSGGNITFERLSGLPNNNFEIVLVTRRFQTKISVSQNGVITTSPPEKR
jgi:type II secretory pathway pseudopilin PulG